MVKKAAAVLLGIAVAAALAIWGSGSKSGAPRVPFVRVTRATISNVLSTNGKVEPFNYVDVRVDAAGLVKKVLVHEGQLVRTGQVIAELSNPGLAQELDAEKAREAQAGAELQTLQAGGRSSDIEEIEGSLNRARTDRDAAERNLESLERLQKQQAATAFEVDQAKQAVHTLDVQIQSLQQRRAALVGKGDLAGAQAKLREAQANVGIAETHITQQVVHSPMSGTIYDLPARPGMYLNIGDPVASVGKLDPVRVRVYVDEPEVGRVATGESVRITWDALPGKEWDGVVDTRPSEIVALGSRQVGEVLCTIANPNHELVPGTNVNAFILTQVVKDALTIPKTALRRDNGIGVYLLEPGDTVRWQSVQTGVSDALKVQVVSGLKDGAEVAETTDQVLKAGEKVEAVTP